MTAKVDAGQLKKKPNEINSPYCLQNASSVLRESVLFYTGAFL